MKAVSFNAKVDAYFSWIGSSPAKDNVIEFAQVSLLFIFVLRPIIYRPLIFKFRAVCQILEAACVSGWVGRRGGGGGWKKSVKSWGKKI